MTARAAASTLAAGRPCAYCVEAGLLGLLRHVVDLSERVGHLADSEGAGAVGAVVVEPRAGVDEHEVALLYHPVAGHRVRARRRRPRRDVDRERRLVRAELVEELGHPPDELLLRPPAELLLGQALVHAVRDPRRLTDGVELAGLLDRPQRLDETAARHQAHTGLAEDLVVRVADRVGLEPDRVGDPTGEVAVDEALGLLDLHPCELPCPLGVAEVGEEPDAVLLHENRGVRALEARQVEDVGRRGDEQRLLEQRPQPVYSRVRNSSASL